VTAASSSCFPPAVLILNKVGVVQAANRSACQFWETEAESLNGEAFTSLFEFDIHSDDADWLEAQWMGVHNSSLDRDSQMDAKTHDGTTRKVILRIEKASGLENHLIATIMPVPVMLETAAAPSSGLDLLSDQGGLGFFDLNPQTGAAQYTAAWKITLGYLDVELADTYATWLDLIHEEDTGAAPDQVGRRAVPGSRHFSVEFRMRHQQGHYVWIHCLGLQIINEATNVERVLGLIIDISERKEIAAAGSVTVIDVDAPEEGWPVLVDRSQILQVFQNLIINAVQAMPPEPHRGLVKIKASNVTLEEDQIASLTAGEYIEISVQDNAAGISEDNLQNIFDPFFTTKKHGTGLGLATGLSIVRKHGGEIGVDSIVGTGTTFTVYLPRADNPAEIQARRAPTRRFGTGRVLFMDDDRKICDLSSTMLKSLDYKFDIAHNGEEAIEFYQRYLNIGRPYDAVIMDINVIGGMGGEECFHELHQLDPDVRAIVSSGYDNEEMATRFLDMGFCGYLNKPYRVADLGKVIKAVLG